MSLLIKNVQIVDGLGNKPYKGDVLIQQDKISAIGNLRGKQAKNSVDGLGNYLVPAFIDPAATADRYLDLFSSPEQLRLKEYGIGTVMGGNGGVSLAPLIYGRLDSVVSRWPAYTGVNIDWHSMADFLKSLRRLNLGVNFGTFAGYETVKEALIGEEKRELSRNEVKIAHRVIDGALKDGAFGVSFSTSSIDAISKGEIRMVANLTGKYHAHISLSLDVKDGTDAVRKAIECFSGKNGKTRVLITDFWPVTGHEGVFEDILSSASDNIRFVVKPYPSIIYQAAEVLPGWLTNERSWEEASKALLEKDVVEKIRPELSWINAEKTLILSSGRQDVLRGKTFKEVSEMYDMPVEDAIIKVFAACKLKVSFLYQSANEECISKHINDKNVFVSGYGNSRFDELLDRRKAEGSPFARAIDIAVRSHSLPIEEAVKQITSAPARFLNIKNRGAVKEGYAADLAIIDKDNFRTTYSVVGGLTGGVPLKYGW